MEKTGKNIRDPRKLLPLVLLLFYLVLGTFIIEFPRDNHFGKKNKTEISRNESTIFIGFENGLPARLGTWDVCCNDSIEIVTNSVFGGQKAAKFTLKPGQNFTSVENIYRTRNEVTPAGAMAEKMEENNISVKGEESWYGFAVRPSENLSYSSTFEVLFQAHHINDKCDTFGGNPPIALYVVEDQYIVQNVGDEDRCQKDWSKVNRQGRERWKFPLEKGSWTRWTFYTNWKHTKEGVFKVWRDGQKVIEQSGEPVTYNDKDVLRFRFGVYKSPWLNNPRKSKRIYYFDNIWSSGNKGSYSKVNPY